MFIARHIHKTHPISYVTYLVWYDRVGLLLGTLRNYTVKSASGLCVMIYKNVVLGGSADF